MSDDFVRDLEDELVAAARYRAAHPAPRIALPRRGVVLRAMAAGAAAVLVVAAVVALARTGNDERAVGTPPVPHGGSCASVSDRLRDRVTALYEPAGDPPPRAALDAAESQAPGARAVAAGARYRGADGGVDFWVVPIARGDCVPATEACVVAVADGNADAICSAGPDVGAVQWRLSPLRGGRSAIFGIVPDRATAVDVAVPGHSGTVPAELNVFGGVLASPVRPDAGAVPEAVYAPISGTPRVGVVDAGGPAGAIRYRLSEAGYATTGVIPGVKSQQPTIVYWRPGRVAREDVARIAALAGAADRREMHDPARTPRPVRDADASVVVVVGAG